MKGFTRYRVDVDDDYITLCRQLTNQPAVKKPPLGKPRRLPPKEPKPAAVEAARALEDNELFRVLSRAKRKQPGPPPAGSPFRVFRDVNEMWRPEMVQLPAGKFMMGSPDTEQDRDSNEGPQHRVHIGYRFELGAYPVTFDEYDYFCEATEREKPGARGWGRVRRPVIFVSWFDAVAYCEWLSNETGHVYRLPSEAEWEYACRSGTTSRYSWGHTIMPDKANYTHSGHDRTTEVDLYPPNAWGLFDMHGNVQEWVEDVWHGSYEGAPTDGSAWTDEERKESSSPRVIRGGSWNHYASACRSACRSWNQPTAHGKDLGFRIARTL